MKVNIAVSGIFHFRNYIEYIFDSGLLNQLYFAHKLHTGNTLGLPSKLMTNIWLKEYLVHGHSRMFGELAEGPAHRVYGSIWTLGVLANWKPANLLHIMAHGYSGSVIARAHRDHAPVIAEVVNTHPENQNEIINREYDRWGHVAPRRKLTVQQKSIISEARSADFVLAPTETVKLSYVSRGIDPTRVFKIPYAGNTSLFYPKQDYSNPNGVGSPLRVVCVGSIGFRKGQLYALEAARRLGDKVVELTLIGSISDELKSVLFTRGFKFKHYPRVDHGALRDVIIGHDLFVHASLEEGLALAIGEAVACGMPIVATRESRGRGTDLGWGDRFPDTGRLLRGD